jgi:hypothetical protein
MDSMITTSDRARKVPSSESDDDIAHYQNLSQTEVEAELREYAIDPSPTLERVKMLVSMKREEFRVRGLLHPKRALTFLRRREAWPPPRRSRMNRGWVIALAA